MINKTILLITIVAILLIGSITVVRASPGPFTVTFETIPDLNRVELIISITNNQDSNDDFPLKPILNQTSIDIMKTGVKLYEWKTEEYERLICLSCEIEKCQEDNQTKETICENNTVEDCLICGNHTEIRERFIWLERNLMSEKKDTSKTEILNQFEEVHIKKGETKKFKLRYDFGEIPINPSTGKPGSYGFVYLDIKGILYYDFKNSSWWNINWDFRIEGTLVSITYNRINHPIEFNVSQLGGSATICNENSIRVFASDDVTPYEVRFNDTDGDSMLDADDTFRFLINSTANVNTSFYVYYDDTENTSTFVDLIEPFPSDTNHKIIWRFDEGTGTSTADRSANAYTGTIYGSPPWTTDYVFGNHSIDNQNATGTYNEYEGIGAIENSGTLEVWFNPAFTIDGSNPTNSTSGPFVLVSVGRGALYIGGADLATAGDDLGGYTYDGAVNYISYSPTEFTAGRWYHAMYSWNNSGRYLWLDGVVVASSADGADMIPHVDYGFTAGAFEQNDVGYNFQGRLDEARMSDNGRGMDYDPRIYAANRPVLTFGTEETPPPPLPPIPIPIHSFILFKLISPEIPFIGEFLETLIFKSIIIFMDRLTVLGNVIIGGNLTANFHYGEIWNYTANATAWTFPIDDSSIYYNLTGLNNAGELNGFTHTDTIQTAGGSYLTAQVSGLYEASAVVTMGGTTAGGLHGMGIVVNNDVTANRDCYVRHSSSSIIMPMVIPPCQIRLDVGDTVNIQIEDESAPAKDILIHTANLHLVRIGN